VESHVSQKARDASTPLRAGYGRRFLPSLQDSVPFLAAYPGLTSWAIVCRRCANRVGWVIIARFVRRATRLHFVPGCSATHGVPSPVASRFTNPWRDGGVESHVSQRTRDRSTSLRAGYGAAVCAVPPGLGSTFSSLPRTYVLGYRMPSLRDWSVVVYCCALRPSSNPALVAGCSVTHVVSSPVAWRFANPRRGRGIACLAKEARHGAPRGCCGVG
jgi:hypothetical protein